MRFLFLFFFIFAFAQEELGIEETDALDTDEMPILDVESPDLAENVTDPSPTPGPEPESQPEPEGEPEDGVEGEKEPEAEPENTGKFFYLRRETSEMLE